MIILNNRFGDAGRITKIIIEIPRDQNDNPVPNMDLEYEVGRVDSEGKWHNLGVHHHHFDDAPASVDDMGNVIPEKTDASHLLMGLRLRHGARKLYKSVEDMLVDRELADRPE